MSFNSSNTIETMLADKHHLMNQSNLLNLVEWNSLVLKVLKVLECLALENLYLYKIPILSSDLVIHKR